MQTYIDKVSGETLYVKNINDDIYFYKDKAMTIQHRVDGPAVTWTEEDGFTVSFEGFYQNNKQHRLDGPAYIFGRSIKKIKSYYVDEVKIDLKLLRKELEHLQSK